MISAIVITRNNVSQLRNCLNHLLNQDYRGRYEVIVIDNASTDSTSELVKNLQCKYGNLRYMYQKKIGRGFARNEGLKQAKGSIIAFTDDDCVVEKGWLNKLEKRFKEFLNVSAVGGAICNRTKSKFGWASYLLNFSSWLPSQKTGYINDIPTANIAYRRCSIKQIRFPESDMDIDYEDTLFNLELIRKGKKMLFDPDIKVYHNFGSLSYDQFITKQQGKGKSFALEGYKAHGKLGLFLVRNPFVFLFCPRIVLIFLRCLKSKKFLIKFLEYFPLLIKGEYTRGLAVKSLK